MTGSLRSSLNTGLNNGLRQSISGGVNGLGFFKIASLDLQFVSKKTLDDRVSGDNLVTFSRASSGTYVGSDGLIKTSPVNLLTYSEEFDNAAWVKALGAFIIPNATTSPDGSNTADKQVGGSETNWFTCTQFPTVTVGTAYVGSIYAKAGGFRYLRVLDSQGTNTYFDLDTGSTSGMEDVGDGWYRCSWSVTTNATPYNYRLYVTDNNVGTQPTGNGVNGVFIWGAQFEEGTTATDYIPTTSTISGAPRFDHDSATGESLGLLIEEARTNVYTDSQDYSGWTKDTNRWNNPTANAGTAPDGTNTATKVVPKAGTVSESIYLRPALSDGVTYTGSGFFKASELSRVMLRSATQGDSPAVSIDLTAGTITATGCTGTITALPNNWYRVTMTWTQSGTVSLAKSGFGVDSSSGETYNGSNGFFVWGSQLEEGSFPTSYIPTSGSTVTRAADVAEITGADFSSFYNQSEGTVFVEAEKPSLINTVAVSINSGAGNTIELRSSAPTTANARFYIGDGGAQQFDQQLAAAGTDFRKMAFGYKANDTMASLDGTNSSLDTSVTLPTVSKLYLGNDLFDITKRPGHIKRLAYFPTRLPDNTLQSITS